MEMFLHTIIREAGRMGLSYFDKEFEVEVKSEPFDLLTEADTAINDYLSKIIRETFPTHSITSEELEYHDGEGAYEYEWVIDPIDGTYNFAHGVGIWAVVIALLKDGEPLYSAIYFPVSNQLFYANETGTYLNGKKLSVTHNTKSLAEAHTQTFAGKCYGGYGVEVEKFQKAKIALASAEQVGARHLGHSAALCFMLSGYVDAAFGNCGLDWDYLATFHILRQAGVMVTDSEGKQWERGRQDYVVAVNEGLHTEMLSFFINQ